jgi:hypothetical protein
MICFLRTIFHCPIFLAYRMSFFQFLLEEIHGRFWRQSIISLSAIGDEYNDSMSLSLYELLTTLAAFFLTKGELTLLHKSLEKVLAITLHGPPHNVILVHIHQHRRSSKGVAVMSHHY